METKIAHKLTAALLFMFSIPLLAHGQWLNFESYYWMKHANGVDEFYYIWQHGKAEEFDGKQYRHFEDSRNHEFFCRLEDNKLFSYDVNDGKEYVLCDYGLSEGDVFQTKDGREMEVTEVGDTLLLTTFRKKYSYPFIRLENVNDPSDTDLWVNSILGSYYNVLMFPEEQDDDIVEQRFMWNDAEILDEFNTETVKTQLMKVEKTEDYISFNEETGEIIYPSDSLHCEFVKDTLVVSGRVYANCTVGHYLICNVIDNQIVFFVQAIPPSAACETSHYFTAKFPGFTQGEYSFLYVPPGMGSPSGELEITGDLVCKGATWQKFVEDGKIWDTRIFNGYYNDYMGNHKLKSLSYELSGDTIIGGTPCMKMYRFEKYNNMGKQYLVSLHEQDGKVFFIPEGSETSYLMYDFNAGEGEMVKVSKVPESSKTYYPYESTLEVIDKEERSINGTNRKFLYMKDVDSPETEDFGYSAGWWVEGVGSLFSPVWNAGFVRYDQGSELERCYVDDNVLYETAEPDYYNMLDANTVWIAEHSVDGVRQTGENPSRMYFTKLELPDTRIEASGVNSWRKIYACENGDTAHSHVVAAMNERLVYKSNGNDFEQKVYIKPYEGAETDYLLYDFSAEAGDEVEVAVFSFDDDYSSPHELNTRRCRIDNVEEKLVEGHHLKHLYVTVADENGSYDDGNNVCWIEGVGSVYGLDGNVGASLKTNQYPESLLVDCSWEGEPFYRFSGVWSDIVNNIINPKIQLKPQSLYDLSGRYLNAIPERGIYIQNGKKYIVN